MGKLFDVQDVFPIIAEVIRTHASGLFLSHAGIANALLQHPEGRAHIDKAVQRSDGKSAEWLAHNMVAWFSQHITTGLSHYDREFERERYEGKWAYRPLADD
jgi:hypothetical protein